jgi:C-terminal processing protease CtpA/Prc
VLTLPASGIRAQIPLIRYDLPTDGTAADRGVIPDIPVEATIGDRLSGRDVVLERALAAARQKAGGRPGLGGPRSRAKPYN